MADNLLAQQTRPGAQARPAPMEENSLKTVKTVQISENEGLSLSALKRQSLILRNRDLEIELGKKTRELIEANSIASEIAAFGATFQRHMQELPYRLARHVAGFTDVEEIRERIQNELYDFQCELSEAAFGALLENQEIPFDDATNEICQRLEIKNHADLKQLVRLALTEIFRKMGGKIISSFHSNEVPALPDESEN